MALEGIDWEAILTTIRPDEKAVWKEVNAFLKKIQQRVSAQELSATVIAGGSIAKGTFLKNAHDVDIFVLFDKKYPTEELANLLEQCLKKLPYERVHGSRDYFKIKSKTCTFEIVPVYAIKTISEAVNITDASPLHVAWVKEQIAKKPKLADSIRLAKAFCKAQEVYGAESYIRGFSGHVLDIITCYYGGFTGLLKAATTWRPKKIIDYYNYHQGRVLKNLNKAKTESPLILIDPTDPNRNAAASLSDEKFYRFVESAQAFLAKPSADFFSAKPVTYASIQKKAKGSIVMYLDITTNEGKEDVEGAKLLKVYEYLRNQLVLSGFPVSDAGWRWDKKKKASLWFITPTKELSKTVEWEGPKITDQKNVTLFKQKHANTCERDERVFALVERKYTKPQQLIKALLQEEYVKEKIKKSTLR